ncbi:uncharacterized protein MELLADRAFT_91150 [Melampsora larici-populina 98AG31]|uniref:Uncharacterized protein n=1 Tax=Melampsora larici-populina (strain 98AG31 / pathotype 3-4-7) TaxID=747676 RepID=F4RY01_MELLP|nr:uncharacterized protein MELLADRAFT_91150 [Melampsora larici-populina 98AG31]EGG02729.1 hypothetical protein MELLADRAFT_91150 [Melampsora larici-populina 98AG31]
MDSPVITQHPLDAFLMIKINSNMRMDYVAVMVAMMSSLSCLRGFWLLFCSQLDHSSPRPKPVHGRGQPTLRDLSRYNNCSTADIPFQIDVNSFNERPL